MASAGTASPGSPADSVEVHLQQATFLNPLSEAAGGGSSRDGAEQPQHSDSASAMQQAAAQPATPQRPVDTVASPAPTIQEAAQPDADADVDVSEAHALLSESHKDSAAPVAHSGLGPLRSSTNVSHDGCGVAAADSDDGDSVSLDSPAAGRPPGGSSAVMANPYFQIEGAMRNPLAGQPPLETTSSRGHKVVDST